MARVIVMGGIGSGKSTVSQLLSHHGYLIIEADRIGHELLEPSGAAHEAVAERWPEVVADDGRIDRAALGAIVFGDLGQLRQLEAMTHPHIRHEVLERSAGLDHVAVELPITPEFLGPNWVSVYVSTDRETRRARLRSRGMSDSQIEARMAAQPSDEQWLEVADHVLTNNGSLEDLAQRVAALVVTLSS